MGYKRVLANLNTTRSEFFERKIIVLCPNWEPSPWVHVWVSFKSYGIQWYIHFQLPWHVASLNTFENWRWSDVSCCLASSSVWNSNYLRKWNIRFFFFFEQFKTSESMARFHCTWNKDHTVEWSLFLFSRLKLHYTCHYPCWRYPLMHGCKEVRVYGMPPRVLMLSLGTI